MERRPWVLASPPIAIAGIAVALLLYCWSQSGGRPMNLQYLEWVAYGLLAVSAIWLSMLVGAWLQRSGSAPSGSPTSVALSPLEPTVRCDRCGESVPSWFRDSMGGGIFGSGEAICFNCAESKPYPLPGESEDDYVARWKRDGRPLK
jgi:hypothetical protein